MTASPYRKGRIKPAGQNQVERDAIALGVIESYMDAVATNNLLCPKCQKPHDFKEITPVQAQLIRARYDKLRPSLSAVEQTTHIDPIPTQQELDSMLQSAIGSMDDIQLAKLGLMRIVSRSDISKCG